MDNYNKFILIPKFSKKQFIVKTTAYEKSECGGFKHIKIQKQMLSSINLFQAQKSADKSIRENELLFTVLEFNTNVFFGFIHPNNSTFTKHFMFYSRTYADICKNVFPIDLRLFLLFNLNRFFYSYIDFSVCTCFGNRFVFLEILRFSPYRR